jgi:Fe(3+) dicitrate transport protein
MHSRLSLHIPLAARRFGPGLVSAVAIASSLALAQSPAGSPSSQDPPATAKPPAAAPQEPAGKPAPTRLPEVVVTESPEGGPGDFQRVPLDNPAARDVITPQEVRESSSVNIQGVLQRSPNIFVTDETGSDSLPNIAVRGLTGNEGAYRSINLTMLADGIPLAPAPYAQPGNSLFPFTLERVYAIDVQRGGAAVRYGPNNVAGVINFLTRPIPMRPTVEGRVRYDTFDNASFYTAVGGTTGPFGMLLEAVYKDGETFRDNGDYTLQNYALKTSYELSSSVRLFAQVETFDDDSHLSDGLNLAGYQADPWQTQSPLNRFEGEQDRANLKLEWDVDADTLFEVITYWFDGVRTFHLGSPSFYGTTPPTYIQSTPRDIRTAAVQPQITHTYSIGSAKGELLVGLRYLQEDTVRNVTRYFPDGTSQVRSEEQYDYYTGSAFVENRFEFDDWTVTPGIRFEYVEIDARNRLSGMQVDKDFTEVLPALFVNRRLTPEWALYGNVQATFAAPQAPQIEISTDPQDISAQYAWVYELGSRTQAWQGLLGTDLTFYQIDYKDRLEPDPDQFDVYLNSGRSRHRGVELALDSDLRSAGLPGFSLWTSLAYNESEYTNGDFEGNSLPASPDFLASWGARYEHKRSGLWTSIDGFYVGEAFSDRENTVDINATGTRGIRPSYSVWNASVGWNHAFSEQSTLSCLVGARNVLDEEYFEIRSGRGIYPGAPSSVVFEVGYTQRF